jgi:hypothetical protein
MQVRPCMNQKSFHVRSSDGGWGVFTHAGQSVSETVRTRADAVIHAKQLALAEGMAQVLIYGEDGSLDSEFFYGRDERSSLGTDDSVSSLAASRPTTEKHVRTR